MLIVAGTPQLIRNIDLEAELGRLAPGLSIDWIDSAARALVQVEQGMRRNLLRSLSLDAMAASLLLRASMLLFIDNAEPRYTLEFFPVFFVWIGALFAEPLLAVPGNAAREI